MLTALLTGCRTLPERTAATRQGEEMVVAGRFFPTDTRIVTWQDTGGYNAYPRDHTPTLKNHEPRVLPAGGKGRPPDLRSLRTVVDQIVLHYDGLGLSSLCFDILQRRGLSAHFLLDVDGTVYQTLDLQERAWHATTSNNRSVGIEIANIGAYPAVEIKNILRWYERQVDGGVRLKIPAGVRDPRIRTPYFTGYPARPELVRGAIHGRELVQHDFTPEQYEALIRLIAALHRVFPKITLDYPRGPDGKVLPYKLTDGDLVKYRGLLGHWHIQENKVDPGPALQWDRLVEGPRP
jgi:N-acetyl-anhydromuramyl-L-alanine amidase AmpD